MLFKATYQASFKFIYAGKFICAGSNWMPGVGIPSEFIFRRCPFLQNLGKMGPAGFLASEFSLISLSDACHVFKKLSKMGTWRRDSLWAHFPTPTMFSKNLARWGPGVGIPSGFIFRRHLRFQKTWQDGTWRRDSLWVHFPTPPHVFKKLSKMGTWRRDSL